MTSLNRHPYGYDLALGVQSRCKRLFTKVSPEGREGRCFAFNSLLTALKETRSSRGYSNWYPKNSRSLTTFSYLTNTAMRCREPLPFPFARLRCQRRSLLIHTIYIERAVPTADSFLCPDRHGIFQPDACLVTDREMRK